MRPERWRYTIPLRWRSLFGRRKVDAELAEVIRQHVERKSEELVARGMAPAAARRAALVALGGAEQTSERCREARRVNRIQDFVHDLRYGARVLGKSPGFAAVALLTLALGIGANTAIFSLVDGILLRPLPYPQANAIVHLSWNVKGESIPNLSVPQFVYCRDHSQSFAALAGYRNFADRELKHGAGSQWVKTLSVTDGFFQTLGAGPAIGGAFDRSQTRPNGPYAAVLTDGLWRSALGADPGIAGKTILLDNQSYMVTGILPPDFKFAQPADVFISLHLGATVGDLGFNTDVIGRLKPGVSLTQAQAEMPILADGYRGQALPLERLRGAYALDRYEAWLGSEHRTSLLMLLGAVGLLLLIACANVASLLLARAISRRREIAMRLALGATRGRLLEQFLAESLLLGLAGGAAGLAGAVAVMRGFVSALPWEVPSVQAIGFDWRVFVFTLLVGLGASVAFGFTSIGQTRKLDFNQTLRDGSRQGGASGAGRGGGRLLDALVVAEVAISLTLALGAGLLLASLHNLYQEKLGFNPDRLVMMETPFTRDFLASTPQASEELGRALERIAAIPGVRSAATVTAAPLDGQGNLPVQRDAHPEDSIGGTELRAISPGYFATAEIPILRGRAFRETDSSGSAPVAIINETLARDWWRGENPIGDRVVIGEFHGRSVAGILEPAREIVGVVGDVKGMAVGRPAPPMVYMPTAQGKEFMNGGTDWVVRTGARAEIGPALRAAMAEAVPGLRVATIQPMNRLVSASVAQTSFESLLMGSLGALALALLLAGVYGVLSFQVGQRTQEIGVRIAMGASAGSVLRVVGARAAALAGTGILIGAGAGLALARLIAGLLYEVKPADPVVFAAVAGFVFAVALLAAFVPAARAARIEPIEALKYR